MSLFLTGAAINNWPVPDYMVPKTLSHTATAVENPRDLDLMITRTADTFQNLAVQLPATPQANELDGLMPPCVLPTAPTADQFLMHVLALHWQAQIRNSYNQSEWPPPEVRYRGTQYTMHSQPPQAFIEILMTDDNKAFMTAESLERFFVNALHLQTYTLRRDPRHDVTSWQHAPERRLTPNTWALTQPIERFVYARCRRLCIGCYTTDTECRCFERSTITDMPDELSLPEEFMVPDEGIQ
jgi:hypothetical protein